MVKKMTDALKKKRLATINCDRQKYSFNPCNNLKEVGGGFEGEIYHCDVCGEHFFLDYEEMR